jgi:hypothetical protein
MVKLTGRGEGGALKIPKGSVLEAIEPYAEWLMENAPVELVE